MKWICFFLYCFTMWVSIWAHSISLHQDYCKASREYLSSAPAVVTLLEVLVSPVGLGAGKGFQDPGVNACFPSLSCSYLHSTVNPVQRWASRLHLHCVFPAWNTPALIVKIGWRGKVTSFTKYSLKKQKQSKRVGITFAVTVFFLLSFPN